jgi:hypothetical protein
MRSVFKNYEESLWYDLFLEINSDLEKLEDY